MYQANNFNYTGSGNNNPGPPIQAFWNAEQLHQHAEPEDFDINDYIHDDSSMHEEHVPANMSTSVMDAVPCTEGDAFNYSTSVLKDPGLLDHGVSTASQTRPIIMPVEFEGYHYDDYFDSRLILNPEKYDAVKTQVSSGGVPAIAGPVGPLTVQNNQKLNCQDGILGDGVLLTAADYEEIQILSSGISEKFLDEISGQLQFNHILPSSTDNFPKLEQQSKVRNLSEEAIGKASGQSSGSPLSDTPIWNPCNLTGEQLHGDFKRPIDLTIKAHDHGIKKPRKAVRKRIRRVVRNLVTDRLQEMRSQAAAFDFLRVAYGQDKASPEQSEVPAAHALISSVAGNPYNFSIYNTDRVTLT